MVLCSYFLLSGFYAQNNHQTITQLISLNYNLKSEKSFDYVLKKPKTAT